LLLDAADSPPDGGGSVVGGQDDGDGGHGGAKLVERFQTFDKLGKSSLGLCLLLLLLNQRNHNMPEFAFIALVKAFSQTNDNNIVSGAHIEILPQYSQRIKTLDAVVDSPATAVVRGSGMMS
jgi:hypothetical protein